MASGNAALSPQIGKKSLILNAFVEMCKLLRPYLGACHHSSQR